MSAVLTPAAIRLMADKGLTATDIAEIAEALGQKERTAAAERQKRYRERKAAEAASDVTRDVTRLRNECDAPREHVVNTTSSSLRSEEATLTNPIGFVSPKPKNSAGTRLPDGWQPLPMPSDFVVSSDLHTAELAKFRDYWRSVPGAKGRKLDWDATWRNWLRRAAEQKPRTVNGNGQRPHPDKSRSERNMDAAVAGAALAAHAWRPGFRDP